MGDFQDFRQYIEGRLSDNWSTTDVVYPNVPYTPDEKTSFIQLVISENTGRQVTYNGSNTATHRVEGFIIVLINVPLNTGTNTGRGYADSIAGIFNNAQFSTMDIVTKTSRIVDSGEVNGMYQFSVITPFYVDVTRSNAS